MISEDIKDNCLSYIVLSSIARYILDDDFGIGDSFIAQMSRSLAFSRYFQEVIGNLFNCSKYKHGAFSRLFDTFENDHLETVIKGLKGQLLDLNQVNFPNYFHGYGDYPRLKRLGNIITEVDFEMDFLGYDAEMLGEVTDWHNRNVDDFIEAKRSLYTELVRKLESHPFTKLLNSNAEAKHWSGIADDYFMQKSPLFDAAKAYIKSNDLCQVEYRLVQLIFMAGVAQAIYAHVTSSAAINKKAMDASLKRLKRVIFALDSNVIPFFDGDAHTICSLNNASGYRSSFVTLSDDLKRHSAWLDLFKRSARRNPNIGLLVLRLCHAIKEAPERDTLCQKMVKLILRALHLSYDEAGVKRWIDDYPSFEQYGKK